MKQIFLLPFLFVGIMAATAQAPTAGAPNPATGNVADPAREAAGRLAAKYKLNAAQTQKMYTIQTRKQRNLAEIEVFKSSNPALYRAKLESIQKGTQSSIRRLLKTKEQQALFQKNQTEQRRLRQAKREEMNAQGASKEAIEAAVLEIYVE